MDLEQVFGVAPWVLVTGVATWVGAGFNHRRNVRKDTMDYAAAKEAQSSELVVELLANARSEVKSARTEMETLREEINTLRSLEQHFYHFEQALEHLEAVMHAVDDEARQHAERLAQAFLTRMRRLQEARGTIANEAQRNSAVIKRAEKIVRDEGGIV